MKKQSIWWQKSVFYDKNPLGIGETPPLLAKKIQQKTQFFLIRKFWIGKGPPPISKKKIDSFWLQKFWIGWDPPPLSAKKSKKISIIFWLGNFGFGETPPPPFCIFSEKKQFFLNDASPKASFINLLLVKWFKHQHLYRVEWTWRSNKMGVHGCHRARYS